MRDACVMNEVVNNNDETERFFDYWKNSGYEMTLLNLADMIVDFLKLESKNNKIMPYYAFLQLIEQKQLKRAG